MPSSFQHCLEPRNTFSTEWCSEARLFRRLSKPPLSESLTLEITRLGYSSIFAKCSKINAHFRNARNNPEKVFCF